MAKKLLPTTIVGSYPKPKWLNKMINEHAAGKVSDKMMEQAYVDAIEKTVKEQELAGIDILWDGEMRRDEMTSYFAEHIDGFKIYGDVRVWGNNYYPKPAIVDRLKYRDALTINEYKYLKTITKKGIKVPITGPYTIVDWSFNEHYAKKDEAVYELAKIINRELKGLARAGAEFIQLDEPAIPTHPEEIEIAQNAMEIATRGVNAYIGVHICYGDYSKIYPKILDFKVDQFDFEFANKNFADVEVFKKYDFTKDIGFGCLDVHTRKIETVEQIKKNIRKAFDIVEPKKVYVDPDCGVKLLPTDIAFAKLKNMCLAADGVREEVK